MRYFLHSDDALILSVDKEDLRTYLKQNDSDSYAIMSNMSKAMLMMKKNIDLLGQELTDLLKNREDSRRTEELKNRIKQSDVRKALLMYSNYSSLLP